MKKILFVLLISSFLQTGFALSTRSQDIITAKLDSARLIFEKEAALRNQRLFDTTNIGFSKSDYLSVYQRAKIRGKDTKELAVQLTKFRSSYYLGVKVRDYKAVPASVTVNNQLFIFLDDQTKLALNNIGGASSKSNGMLESCDLVVDYEIPRDVYNLLLTKRIASFGVTSNLGIWTFDIEGNSADQLRLLMIRNK
jgi:hypothetical protein